jgi:hypothetical protein
MLFEDQAARARRGTERRFVNFLTRIAFADYEFL